MDIMKLETGLITSLISKIIKKNIKTKIGLDANINLKRLDIKNDGKRTNVKIELEGSIDTSDIPAMIEKFNLF